MHIKYSFNYFWEVIIKLVGPSIIWKMIKLLLKDIFAVQQHTQCKQVGSGEGGVYVALPLPCKG